MEGKKKSWYIRKAVSYKIRSSRSGTSDQPGVSELRTRSFKDHSDSGVRAISGSFRRDDSVGESLHNSSQGSNVSQPSNGIYRDESMGLFRSQSIEDLIDKYAPLPERRGKSSDVDGETVGRIKYTIAYTGAKYGCSPIMSPTPGTTRHSVSKKPDESLPNSQEMSTEESSTVEGGAVDTQNSDVDINPTCKVDSVDSDDLEVAKMSSDLEQNRETSSQVDPMDTNLLLPSDNYSPSQMSTSKDSAVMVVDEADSESSFQPISVTEDEERGSIVHKDSKDSDDSGMACRSPPRCLSPRVPFEKVQTPSFTQIVYPPSVVISDHSHETSYEENLCQETPEEAPEGTDSGLGLHQHLERKFSNCSDVSERSDSSRSMMSDSSYSIDDDDLDYGTTNFLPRAKTFVSTPCYLLIVSNVSEFVLLMKLV